MAKKKVAKNKSKKYSKVNVYEFHVSLVGTNPLVWRTFLAHEIIELAELHMLIQICMGWDNKHLYKFIINKKSYGVHDADFDSKTIDAEGLLLCDVLGDLKNFDYVYDFGDSWEHKIKITKVLEHDSRLMYPACIDGANACPPEDCGGVRGFEELKEVLAGKECKQKDELLSWVGGFYNPKTFDPNFVNKFFLWHE